ncbi:MAG: hypothetical protein KKC46_16450 [Proteobacteria bacterium]|nr:hypothetical protein [Pseudomonadota bacterium]
MVTRCFKSILILLICVIFSAPNVLAGNKKMMAIMAAKNDAMRGLTEQVYGLKIRASEEVRDMAADSYVGKTDSKTSAVMSGIKISDIAYDSKQDIARATATMTANQIVNIEGADVALSGKVFKHVGFGTSSPANAGPLKALRAAQIDAYKQLAQQIAGFTLESQTSVENYMLKSDFIKTKVQASLAFAEIVDFGWDEAGDAFVKMVISIDDVSAMLGEAVVGAGDKFEVEGQGALVDDFRKSKAAKK